MNGVDAEAKALSHMCILDPPLWRIVPNTISLSLFLTRTATRWERRRSRVEVWRGGGEVDGHDGWACPSAFQKFPASPLGRRLLVCGLRGSVRAEEGKPRKKCVCSDYGNHGKPKYDRTALLFWLLSRERLSMRASERSRILDLRES